MGKVTIKSKDQITSMRAACQIVRDVLQLLGNTVIPGMQASEMDRMAEEYIRSQGAEPAFKGYGSDEKNLFPASICVSINDEVVHGIPDGRVLHEGDIVSIDVGVKKNGYFGDGARTFAVGRISVENQRLMKVTEDALYQGIARARSGNHVYDISGAVQKSVESNGFSVVKDLVGHGVGKELHEDPAVPNFVPRGEISGVKLRAGMTLAIEPMVNAGTDKVRVDADGWTVRTMDGRPSAHFEHTILVTDGEPEVLTA